MKKHFLLLAVLLLGAICSCTKDKDVDKTAPECVITSPANGDSFANDQKITISGNIKKGDGSIKTATLKIGEESFELISMSFEKEVELSKYPVGKLEIRLEAIDEFDNKAETSVEINITQAEIKAAFEGITSSEISYESAKIAAKLVSTTGGELKERGFMYKKESDQEFTSKAEGNGIGEFNSTLENLEHNTKYIFKAYAKIDETIVSSEEYNFTTLKIEAPEVTTGEATELTSVSAKMSGSAQSETEITERGFVYSTSENPTIEDGTKVVSNKIDGDNFTSTINGLTAETTYYVKAYAINKGGIGYGNQTSFTTEKGSSEPDVFTDPRDGNEYKTCTIGDQVWMAENLRWLPSVNKHSDDAGDDNLGEHKVKYYYVRDYDGTDVDEAKATAAYQEHGVYYTFWAAMDDDEVIPEDDTQSKVQGVCPEGWHMPSKNDWEVLYNYVYERTEEKEVTDETGAQVTIRDVARELKSTTGWDFYKDEWGGNGYDTYGFNVKPSGYLYQRGLGFDKIGRGANFYSPHMNTDRGPGFVSFSYAFEYFGYANFTFSSRAASVRCIKD